MPFKGPRRNPPVENDQNLPEEAIAGQVFRKESAHKELVNNGLAPSQTELNVVKWPPFSVGLALSHTELNVVTWPPLWVGLAPSQIELNVVKFYFSFIGPQAACFPTSGSSGRSSGSK